LPSPSLDDHIRRLLTAKITIGRSLQEKFKVEEFIASACKESLELSEGVRTGALQFRVEDSTDVAGNRDIGSCNPVFGASHPDLYSLLPRQSQQVYLPTRRILM